MEPEIPSLLLGPGGWSPEGFHQLEELPSLLLLLDLGLHLPSAHQSCFDFLEEALLDEWPSEPGVDPFALVAFVSLLAENHLL
jgi:hypothetical protein